MAGSRILFTVLDWGLGHASRSIPVIKALLKNDCNVLIASDGGALQLLKEALPAQKYFELPGYHVRYPRRNVVMNGVLNTRNILRAIKTEQSAVQSIVESEGVDAIISDNRYGCHSPGILSVLITHQLSLHTRNPLFRWLASRTLHRWLKPFDEIWVPDVPDHQLSGNLSDSGDPRIHFIGWLSTIVPLRRNIKFDIAVILSGPEPQRTRFERLLAGHLQLLAQKHKIAVVRGLSEPDGKLLMPFAEVTDFMGRFELADLVNSSQMVVCRSGYSSLMDLMAAGKKALLIPTPGQPEQEYLAQRAGNFPQFICQEQRKINLKEGIAQLENITSPKPADRQPKLLGETLDRFLRSV